MLRKVCVVTWIHLTLSQLSKSSESSAETPQKILGRILWILQLSFPFRATLSRDVPFVRCLHGDAFVWTFTEIHAKNFQPLKCSFQFLIWRTCPLGSLSLQCWSSCHFPVNVLLSAKTSQSTILWFFSQLKLLANMSIICSQPSLLNCSGLQRASSVVRRDNSAAILNKLESNYWTLNNGAQISGFIQHSL